MMWRMMSLPSLSLGWALPAKMICTGSLGNRSSSRVSRSASRSSRSPRL